MAGLVASERLPALRLLPVALVLFGLSFILPTAYSADGGSRVWSGAELVQGLLEEREYPVLLFLEPNAIFGLAALALFLGEWWAARFFGTVAALCAGLEWFLPEHFSLLVGYYVWGLSMGLVALAAWVRRR